VWGLTAENRETGVGTTGDGADAASGGDEDRRAGGRVVAVAGRDCNELNETGSAKRASMANPAAGGGGEARNADALAGRGKGANDGVGAASKNAALEVRTACATRDWCRASMSTGDDVEGRVAAERGRER
jgi:hypothetical protein